MKLKLKLIICLFCASLSVAMAQDARSILDKAADNFYKSGGLTAGFIMNSKELKSNTIYSYDGHVWMKGEKFKIDMPEMTNWFDGKTQWVYIKETEEVNITIPSDDELQSMSPSVLFSVYKKGFTLNYKGQEAVDGKTAMVVELAPQSKKSSVKKLVVYIDKTTNFPSKLVMYDDNGYENTIIIRNLKSQQNLADSLFVFDAKQYPEVEIIDLR